MIDRLKSLISHYEQENVKLNDAFKKSNQSLLQLLEEGIELIEKMPPSPERERKLAAARRAVDCLMQSAAVHKEEVKLQEVAVELSERQDELRVELSSALAEFHK